MRSLDEVAAVQRLIKRGLNDCEISRRTGVPRSTVREWRTGSRRRAMPGTDSCTTCGHPGHDPATLPAWEYAYLLGLYLGDGCILRHPRDVFRLTISLDRRYPAIIAACASAAESVINRPPGITTNAGWVDVNSYSKQWPCLFPQHGSGVKHLRPIVLAGWQQAIVDDHPGALARGLIHSAAGAA
jgi:hypothetical protein